VVWAARYEGVARDLVAALKFAKRVPVATVLAGAIAAALQGDPGAEAVVAVPPAPARRRRRGFDAAELIAAALGAQLGLPVPALLRRANGPRQVGRRRADRLASPPRVEAVAPPAAVLLVDDVLTTGATLAACATALGRAGASEVSAAVFARALGPEAPAA
jgi:predicted amidophosphoribosyltransferase